MIDPAIMPIVWDLWKSIEALHVQKNASLRHQAWMHFVGPLAMAEEMHPCLVAQAGVFLDVEGLNSLPKIPQRAMPSNRFRTGCVVCL